jgi:hypothetical protein
MSHSLIGIDPGETTGATVFDSSKVSVGIKSAVGEVAAGAYTFLQFPTKTNKEYYEFGKWLVNKVWQLEGPGNLNRVTVVLENFDFRKDEGMEIAGKRQRPKIIYTSSELVGVMKYLSAMNGFDLHIQSAATGKGFWDDDKLKRAGLYTAGMRHARDATRHLLHYRTYTLNDQTMLYALQRP